VAGGWASTMRVVNANVVKLAFNEVIKAELHKIKGASMIQRPTLRFAWDPPPPCKNGGWIRQFPSDPSVFRCCFTWEAGILMADCELRLPDEIDEFRALLQNLKEHLK